MYKRQILSYEVLETWKNKEDAQDCGERNLIRIDLDTGRHHQIRVQMAHAGMPLVDVYKRQAYTRGR